MLTGSGNIAAASTVRKAETPALNVQSGNSIPRQTAKNSLPVIQASKLFIFDIYFAILQ